jgi:hypothetical protein
MTGRQIFCLLALFAARFPPAVGSEYVAPQGFSFHYPDGWKVVTQDDKKMIHKKAHDLGIPDRSFRHSLIIMVQNPAGDQFCENINFVISPGGGQIEDINPENIEGMKKEIEAIGIKVGKFQYEKIKIGELHALSIHQDLKIPGFPHPVRQWQVIMLSSTDTYTISCTALASEFKKYEPLFMQTIRSFHFPDSRLSRWSRIPLYLRESLIGVLFCGMIGGMAGGLYALKRRRTKDAAREKMVFRNPSPTASE